MRKSVIGVPKVGPGRFEQRAAVAHIAHDIVDIGLRDDAALAVAVEDDQVELVELDIEQLADRKGDQRQFADRRAVLLLRRPQDREMHEIDRRVGFQDVAPDALAGMRLARDEQHAQPVAHAVDDDRGAVVRQRQFLRPGLGLDFQNVRAAVIDRDRQRHVAPDRHHHRMRRAAVLAPGDASLPFRRRVLPSGGAGRSSTRTVSGSSLPTSPKLGALRDREPAVMFVPVSREQHVQRRAQFAGGGVRRRPGTSCTCPSVIMTISGEALARHIGQAAAQRGEQLGAVAAAARLVLAGAHDPHIEVAFAAEPFAQRRQRPLAGRAPLADVLARATRRRR